METEKHTESPRLVETGRGLSVLNTVEYQGRFLYSKYNPAAAVSAFIQRTVFLPETLVIICSPVLWYGLTDLLDKAKSCSVMALEADPKLFALAEKTLSDMPGKKAVSFFRTEDLEALDDFLRDSAESGGIRRVMRVDFSAGAGLHADVYDRIISAAQEIVGGFWKNRLTLTKMGRLYCKNLLRNSAHFSNGMELSSFAGRIGKPVVVCGAGESLDALLSGRCAPDFPKDAREGKYFILAVDAAFLSLQAHGIMPDAVVGVESQNVILKAYSGARPGLPAIFLDLVSAPKIKEAAGAPVIWFLSDFTGARFIRNLKDAMDFKSVVPALGSVGLTAVHIALTLRKDRSVPVYAAGLDFSYTAGVTHAKGTYPHRERMIASCRTRPIENYDASYADDTQEAEGKDGRMIRTSAALRMYADLFNRTFSGTENLFDAGATGIPLSIPRKFPVPIPCGTARTENEEWLSLHAGTGRKNPGAVKYLEEERMALEKARDLLKNGERSAFYEPGENLARQTEDILRCREYLFLHFPDGYKFSMDTAFLKRVRAETDFFLKQIGLALKD